MKVSIYIEGSVQQVNLTPENDFEKNILNSLAEKKQEVEIFKGSFYQCQGGWNRQADYPDSMMIVLKEKTV